MSVRSIEAHGSDVEEAIEAGLAELGLERKDVIIEVVEEARKGLLGLGSREATVRLTALPQPEPRQRPGAAAEEQVEPELQAEMAPAMPESEPVTEVTSVEELRQVGEERTETPIRSDDFEDVEVVEVASDIVRTLLDKMGYDDAQVSVTQTEADDKTGRIMTIIHVYGDDLGRLIGSHGDTLNDFQYIARLMAGHALRRRADFLVDIDNYRQQRKDALTSLAQRMADKAVERNRAVTLEPMSAYDRRIIHMALRDHAEVYTNSVGEGETRRVRIYLKQEQDA
jgi:spoIIIJ-associated protein